MHNNIHAGGGRRQMLSSVDFYRHVPKDLTEVRVAVGGSFGLCFVVSFVVKRLTRLDDSLF